MLQWLKRDPAKLHITASYNLIYNASRLVDEGLGYALAFDKLIHTSGDSSLVSGPESSTGNGMFVIWKNPGLSNR